MVKRIKTTIVTKPRRRQRKTTTTTKFKQLIPFSRQELLRRKTQSNRDRNNFGRKRIQNVRRRGVGKGPTMTGMSQAGKEYMHCRINPFQSSGLLGIPDLSDQPRVVVDHRLICNFTTGDSGGFNIVVMPWLPHPLLVRPLVFGDTTWLFDGVHPILNGGVVNLPQYYFAPATFNEWANQTVNREATPAFIDTVNIPYDSKRFRFVTIGAKIIYTGSTLANAGTILVNDGNFTIEMTQTNNELFHVFEAGINDQVDYGVDEIMVQTFNFDQNFNVRSNSSLNTPMNTGAYMLLKNQAADHPWHPIASGLTFPTWVGLNDYCNMTSNQQDMLAFGKVSGYPCVQAVDPNFCPKLISIQGLPQGSPFQIELVYCVEYAIDPTSNIVSLAKQPPADVQSVQRVDTIMRDHPANLPLGNELVRTIGTTVSDTVSGIATAFSPFNHPQLPQRSRFSNRLD